MWQNFFTGRPEWLIVTLLVLLMTAAAELGFRAGLRHAARIHDAARSSIDSVSTALIGMLALLLAFTLSMAVTRYDARKLLVVEETNAIGTAWLRSETLPEPDRGHLNALLGQYVDVLLVTSEPEPPSQERRIELLHQQLWAQALSASTRERTPITAIFLQALNSVIDLHGERVAAVENQVPSTVIWLLCGVSVLASLLIGFGFGISRRRSLLLTFCFVAVVASLLLVIVDLDRPRNGLILVGDSPLVRLHDARARQRP